MLLCTAAGRAAGARVLAARAAASPPLPNVVIATAIPPNPCAFPTADYINKLSVANKQDYAHRHGFEVHLSAGLVDPNVTAVRTCIQQRESSIRTLRPRDKVVTDRGSHAYPHRLQMHFSSCFTNEGFMKYSFRYEIGAKCGVRALKRKSARCDTLAACDTPDWRTSKGIPFFARAPI